MPSLLFLKTPYARSAEGKVLAVSGNGGLVLDQVLFYATSGGQPCDLGCIRWENGSARVTDVRKGVAGEIEVFVEPGANVPAEGASVIQELDWERRNLHMRIHTALHLLSVVIPLPVTGGSISTLKGRLDFDMPDAVTNKEELEQRLNDLVDRDLPVTDETISDEELAANPQLVKTMAVKPPTGAGLVRLVRIGSGEDTVDLQPCGGTHVASTAEIGPVRIGKIQKKGRRNRRVNIFLN
ncbi:MAG: alanyl-tRNA editing protein [Rhodobacteraceae bacterium]|nr:alanyl-tRNA editing protein [Paracoccaceae bacterium]